MKLELPDYRFCSQCGGSLVIKLCEGQERPVCISCGFIVYVNPVPAACEVVLENGKVLLTLRATDPHKGMWCLPGGFIEWGESPEEGAKRELFEETGIRAEQLKLAGVYDSISGPKRHVMLVAYRVLVWSGELSAGDDADEATWFDIENIPPLAFKVHERVLADIFGKERTA